MATRSSHSRVRALAERQHDVVSYEQLDRLGFTRAAVRHARATGRFELVRPRVVAVGRRQLTVHGQLMAGVLACPGAILSHISAALLWELITVDPEPVHLTVPPGRQPAAGDL